MIVADLDVVRVAVDNDHVLKVWSHIGACRASQSSLMFINNEHVTIVNMPGRRTRPALAVYRPALHRWLPTAELRAPTGPLAPFDALVAFKTAGKTMRYLVQEKPHLRHQDVAAVVEQLKRLRAGLPRAYAGARVLFLAPHVRPQQAAVLERTGIDYIDLAGNAHLQTPGLLVHVEGRRLPKTPTRAPGRPQTGWIKAVMAVLIRPKLINTPYRALADRADVALGTVAGCMRDLVLRGLVIEGKGGRRITDRNGLVALWVQAYVEGLRPKLPERRLQVRATDKDEICALLKVELAKRRQPWALTGADAAGRRTHFLRVEETEIYAPVHVFDDRALQKALVAQPAARDGNLLVIAPPGPLAIPPQHGTDVPIAPDLLAYAELRYRATGQALEAADLLLPRVLDDAAD